MSGSAPVSAAIILAAPPAPILAAPPAPILAAPPAPILAAPPAPIIHHHRNGERYNLAERIIRRLDDEPGWLGEALRWYFGMQPFHETVRRLLVRVNRWLR